MNKPSRLLTLVMAGILLIASPALAQTMTNHLEAAQNYMRSKQWDYASYEWRAVLEQYPKNVEAHVGLADSLTRSGYPLDAIMHLKSVRGTIKDPAIDIALAQSLSQVGRHKLAGDILTQILRKDPVNLKAFMALNELLPKLGPAQKASSEKFLQKIADFSRKKAISYAQDGRYNAAAKLYEIPAYFFNQETDTNDYGLVLLLAGKNNDAAEKFADLQRKKQESSWVTYANAALASVSVGKASQAIAEMEKAIAACPSSVEKAKLYNNLGFIYETVRRPTKAQYAYERAVELNPGYRKAQLNLAYAYLKNEELEKAINLYRMILTHEPQNAQVWNLLGFAYEMDMRNSKAEEAYRKAILYDPKMTKPYTNLAALYKKMDKLEKANEVYKSLANVEFASMEQEAKATQARKKPRLLDYVEIFFSNATLQPKVAG